jgi:hypothetical protein
VVKITEGNAKRSYVHNASGWVNRSQFGGVLLAESRYCLRKDSATGVQGVAVYATIGGTLERTVTQGMQNPVRVAVDP